MKQLKFLTISLSLTFLFAVGRISAAVDDTNTPALGTVALSLSTNTAKVIELLQSGVEEAVVLAFVESSATPFAPAADDIIYLKDLGISAEIITAMLHRDAVLREAPADARPPDVEAVKPVASTDQAITPVVYVTNAPTEVGYFYEPLSPYGTWIEIDRDWYWQPHVVVIDRGWRPYCHGGRWVYSDYGWYWHSDYTWGWAPFHYGRWHHHHHHGWVWYPELVWAPAWVTWRFSDSYWGWAPLPRGAHFVIGSGWYFNNVSVGINFDFHLGYDCFTYVEPRHFHHHRLHVHAVSPTHARGIHVHAKPVNNHSAGPNKQIINHGIAIDKVVAATKQDIRPARIVETPVARGQVIKGDRLAKVGSSTVIQRPELKPPVQARSPVAQKVDDQRAVVPGTPERPPVSAPPRSIVRAVPPSVGAPSQTPQPSRPKTPAVAPSPARRVEPAPSPRSTPPAYVRPAPMPRPAPTPPARHESPRGRDQRLSNGPSTHRSQPAQSKPPSSHPPPQKHSTRERG